MSYFLTDRRLVRPILHLMNIDRLYVSTGKIIYRDIQLYNYSEEILHRVYFIRQNFMVTTLRVTSEFRRDVDQIFALLGC
jgi:hypothetical protein